ncbi:Fe2+-dependent dioxygenase [Telmatospirillum siberiense]|uniref:Fe2+-dependent dioxygenase n=1 Tax=Telmatospirillum siberiense TaxID=382514 RepID=A0A2N3PYZ0_9PROT|nr:Fe2+-dependent dioxygenase [Telmatospirillum siberiense]PKU25627.1 Fe2+-dependent dioxygenase [Telmatospirillum siberiense]
MLTHIPGVLGADQLTAFRNALDQADWIDGRVTAGYQSSRVKNNHQLAPGDPTAERLGALILAELARTPLFIAAALPLKVVPPLFNRYAVGQTYGNHVDGAVRPVEGSSERVRTDLSATLFLSPPDDYDGGELVIEDSFGAHRVKLAAGDMVLYPGSSLHRVEPVTRGVRLASFFWIQSMIREDGQRRMLFDLDSAIQQLAQVLPEHQAVPLVTSVYHNLLRRWAEA